MTVIRPNSISGITSITSHQNDVAFYKSDGSGANINNISIHSPSGIITSANFKTGSSNLHSTGLTVGNNFLHSTGINVGTGATIHVPATNVLTLGTNSNERLRITSEGQVKLTGSNSGNHMSTFGSNVGGLTIDDVGQNHTALQVSHGSNNVFLVASSNNSAYLSSYGTGNMVFELTGGGGTRERFRIGSSGQLGIAGANYGSSGQVLTSQGSGSAPQWATPSSSGTTINNNADYRLITGDANSGELNAESTLRFLASNSGNAELAVTAPEGGDAELHLNADENDDMFDRYKLVSGADNHFQMYQMGAGGGWESRFKLHSERGNPEFIHDPIGLHGGGVVVAQCNTNSGNSSDSPNFKVDFTVPMGDINTIKRDGAREGFAASGETGSTINPHGGSGILIASSFGNYYWGFATKIYHISCYGSYSSGTAVSLNQLHSYTGAGHGANASHITLSVQSNPANTKTTPTLRATFGGDYWSSNYLVVTYVGSGVASFANLRSLSHINSVITGQDTAYK